jgi:hypothetical protein
VRCFVLLLANRATNTTVMVTMSKAHLASLAAFLAFALAGIAGFFWAEWIVTGIGLFLGAGLAGSIVAAKLFDRLATPDEKRQDLEDRVRNQDL